MNQRKYIFEIRFLQMFIFPPWGIYRIVTGEKMKNRKKAGIFLIIWTITQWFLLMSVGSNKIMTLICTNMAISLFFLINIYVGLDMSEFSEEEKTLINAFPLKVLATSSSFFVMYSIPGMLSEIYSRTNIDIFSNNIIWTKLSIILSVVLIISWFSFMFIDKYRIFSLFPKTEFKDGLYRLMPLTSEKLTVIYLFYISLVFAILLYAYKL